MLETILTCARGATQQRLFAHHIISLYYTIIIYLKVRKKYDNKHIVYTSFELRKKSLALKNKQSSTLRAIYIKSIVVTILIYVIYLMLKSIIN